MPSRPLTFHAREERAAARRLLAARREANAYDATLSQKAFARFRARRAAEEAASKAASDYVPPSLPFYPNIPF
jgi:hypothetical protein